MKFAFAVSLSIAALAPLAAAAHHGWSGQDNAKMTVLEGPIQSVSYRNPHGAIAITGPDKQRWDITLAPLQRMRSRGLTEANLKVGQVVRIEGHRNLDTSRREVKANTITIAGKTTELR
jgi:hypothetical protein